MKASISQFRARWAPLAGATVVLAVLPIAGAPHSWLLYIFLFFVYLVIANMWNLLAGYSGLLLLAPAAFIGIAGYTMAVMTWLNFSFYLGLIVAGIVAAAFAALISVPVFRLRGVYFAIGTLVLPEILKVLFLIWRPVGGALHGGGAGYMIKGLAGVSMAEHYWLALIVAMASIFVIRLVLPSKLGMGLAAIRDDDISAASSGINVFVLKLYSFLIAAFFIGLAGAVFYTYQGYVEPMSAFNISWLMIALLGTVIGGEGIEEGPIVGAIVVVILHFVLARYAGLSLMIQGAILLLVMLLAPEGIMGFIRKTRPPHSLLQLVTRGRLGVN